jgi:hypothetical protein
MNDLDQRLARVLQDVVPHPPRPLDAAAIRRGRARRARLVRVLAPALAAAVVVAVAVVGALLAGSPRHHQPADKPAPQHTPYADTLRAVERLLNAAPVLPGADVVDHAPTPALQQPFMQPGSPNDVDRIRWWTAPGTVNAALAYFRAHPAPGVVKWTSEGRGNPIHSLLFNASGAQWTNPTAYAVPGLFISVVQLGDHVAVRANAHAVWLPQRTPAEQIPMNVTSVDVILDRHAYAPRITRTLAAPAARSLATVVNSLPVEIPGGRCPADIGFTDTLTFHTPTTVIRVAVEVEGCQPVTVTRPGGAPQPVLSGGGRLNHALITTLGLPKSRWWY